MASLVAPLVLAAAIFASLRWASSWFAALDSESLLAVAAAVEASSSSSLEEEQGKGKGSSSAKRQQLQKKKTTPSLFDEPTRSLTVVVPAYNEEARLPLALDEALAFLDARRDAMGPSFSFEVVIVDDGSTDGTSRVAEEYARRRGGGGGSGGGGGGRVGSNINSGDGGAVRLVRLAKNSGKGAAVRAGAMAARGARLLMMDADGATKVSDLDRLDEALDKLIGAEVERRQQERRRQQMMMMVNKAGGGSGGGSGGGGTKEVVASSSTTSADSPSPSILAALTTPPAWSVPAAALGSRAHMAPGVAAKRAAHRNLLMRGFHLLVVAVAGSAVRDTQCGFKLFTRSAARLLFGNQRLQRWCFDVELVHLATSRLSLESGGSCGGGDGFSEAATTTTTTTSTSSSTPAVPLVEVAVNWREVPGSKVRLSSIVHMAIEMGAILVGYGTGAWVARGEGELVEAAREAAAASSARATTKKVV